MFARLGLLFSDEALLPGPSRHPPVKRRLSFLCFVLILIVVSFCTLSCLHLPTLTQRFFETLSRFLTRFHTALASFDWRASAAFRVTDAMKVSIAMSMALGTLLGVGVGLISGPEPAVVIGVSASMALGCVFVMSFAILHGVNALRAVSFALFVSTCLPFGFGFGFGVGILLGVFLGLEEADEIREKTKDFLWHFGDFVKVVTAFTLEIL